MIFLEVSISQFLMSTHAHFYLSEPDLPSSCLMQLKSLIFKLLIDLLRSDVRNFHLPVPCLKFCFSSIHCLLCRSLSSDGYFSFPFTDSLEIFSQRMHDTLISLPLNVNWKQLKHQTLDQNSYEFPECHYDCQPTHNPPSASGGYYSLKILTLWELCLLRFACCCWMRLFVETFSESSVVMIMVASSRRGNFRWMSGSLIAACATRSCRCGSWAHGLGLSKQPSHSTPTSGRTLVYSAPFRRCR